MATRSVKLKDKIQRIIGVELPTLTYSVMDDYQAEIAKKLLCIEAKMNLTVLSGTSTYSLLTGGVLTTSPEGLGTVEGIREVMAATVPTRYEWDIPFVEETTDYEGNTIPAYEILIIKAYVTDPAVQETITLTNKTLAGVTFTSTSDTTRVSFITLASGSLVESSSGTNTGFYAINHIEFPSGKAWALKQVNRNSLEFLKKNISSAPTNNPTHFSVYNNICEFAYTPQASETYVVYFYKLPTTNISGTTAPETPERYDNLLIYGAASELLASLKNYDGARYYGERYKEELAMALGAEEISKSKSLQGKN